MGKDQASELSLNARKEGPTANKQSDGSEAERRMVKKQSFINSQKVFKYAILLVVGTMIFCIKGFYQFRQHCISRGYHVFALDSLVWCAIGFFGVCLLKEGYKYFFFDFIQRNTHSRYTGEDRAIKAKANVKLSLDTIIYSSTTIFAYYTFAQEYWFPSAVGGCGACEHIYKEYPNWPSSKQSNLEMYFMTQLGMHTYSVFEMLVIKRKSEAKFYEYMLHHVVAASLILFSMMSNQVAAGVMILIVHDASDIGLAISRCIIEMKWNIKHIEVFVYSTMMIVWIYMRIIIYPFCLLSNVFVNKPTPKDQWFIINFEYNYLLYTALVLYAMHIFWTYFLIKIGHNFLISKKFENSHDKVKSIKD